jgi:hypothetical protein
VLVVQLDEVGQQAHQRAPVGLGERLEDPLLRLADVRLGLAQQVGPGPRQVE